MLVIGPAITRAASSTGRRLKTKCRAYATLNFPKTGSRKSQGNALHAFGAGCATMVPWTPVWPKFHQPALSQGFLALEFNHAKSAVLSRNSNREGINAVRLGSFMIPGAKNDVVVTSPFEAFGLVANTPTMARTSLAVTTWSGL